MKKSLFALLVLSGIFTWACKEDEAPSIQDAEELDIRVDADVIEVRPEAEVPVEVPPEVQPDAPCNPLYDGACNAIDNCNCAADQACRLVLGADRCSITERCEAGGTLPVGSECRSNDQCVAGTSCLTSDLWGSKCVKWCDDDADCDYGRSCNTSVTFELPSGCEPPTVTLAYKACDLGCPLDDHCNPFISDETDNGCAATEACVYYEDCGVLACIPAGTATEGQVCGGGIRCVRGYDCVRVGQGAPFTCRKNCDDDHPCATGDCSPWSSPYPANPDLGVCL